MKKLLICCFGFILFIAFAIQASPNSHRRHKKKSKDNPDKNSTTIFGTYPIAFFGSNLKIGIEHYFPTNMSFCLVPNYIMTQESNLYEVDNLSSFGLEVQLRFYLNKSGDMAPLNGFFLSPFLLFSQASFTDMAHYYSMQQQSRHASTFGVGFYMGWQRIFHSGLSISGYAGGGIMNPNGDYRSLNAAFNPYTKGVKPRASLVLGFAF